MDAPQTSPGNTKESQDSQNTGRADSAGHAAHDVQPRNSTKYDFTKLEDLREYLKERRTGHDDFELRLLTGGTANYVYRLTEVDGEGKGNAEIFKHAAKQLASNPNFALDPERMDYEAEILVRLSEEADCHCTTAEDFKTSEIENTHVHTADFRFYEKDLKLLNIKDGGNWNLKDAYMELSAEDVQQVGSELGKWLANLHGTVPKTHVSSTVPGRTNNKLATEICRYSYAHFSAVLSKYGHDEDLGRKINKYFGGLIAKDKECVCHGDFWPGNVLLQSGVAGKGPFVVTVIDWEMVRIGNSATDIGQFAAEAFLLDRFHGNKGLRSAFIRAYFKSSAVSYGDKERMYPWMTRIAIHFAVHLVFWPAHNVHWTKGQDTKALVDLGVSILQDVVSSEPNVTVWGVFEGLSGLDVIAEDLMEKRGDAYESVRHPGL